MKTPPNTPLNTNKEPETVKRTITGDDSVWCFWAFAKRLWRPPRKEGPGEATWAELCPPAPARAAQVLSDRQSTGPLTFPWAKKENENYCTQEEMRWARKEEKASVTWLQFELQSKINRKKPRTSKRTEGHKHIQSGVRGRISSPWPYPFQAHQKGEGESSQP